MDGLTELSTGGIFAYLVIKEFIVQINRKKLNGASPQGLRNKLDETSVKIHDMEKNTLELISMHKGANNKEIGNQIRDIWYDRKAYHKTMEKLYNAVDTLTLVSKANTELMQDICDAFKNKKSDR